MFKLIGNWWRNYKCSQDWHDYHDDVYMNTPSHFYIYTCRYCKKPFQI